MAGVDTPTSQEEAHETRPSPFARVLGLSRFSRTRGGTAADDRTAERGWDGGVPIRRATDLRGAVGDGAARGSVGPLAGQGSMLDESIYLEPYDPAWEQAFQSERKRLSSRLGLTVDMIEHIGSTAVPGLLAKPIVDIMIGVSPFPPPVAWPEVFPTLGYEALGEAGVPGRLYFRQRGRVPYNVHVVEHHGTHWVNNLALRDYLRGSPRAVGQYESAKRAAIAAGATTLLAYSEAKGGIIQELLRKALEQRAGN